MKNEPADPLGDTQDMIAHLRRESLRLANQVIRAEEAGAASDGTIEEAVEALDLCSREHGKLREMIKDVSFSSDKRSKRVLHSDAELGRVEADLLDALARLQWVSRQANGAQARPAERSE